MTGDLPRASSRARARAREQRDRRQPELPEKSVREAAATITRPTEPRREVERRDRPTRG